MKSIKGPALFLGQFVSDIAPFNSWDSITKWAAECGYIGVQVPSWAGNIFNLEISSLLMEFLKLLLDLKIIFFNLFN